MITNKGIITISTEFIEAIIGKEEVEILVRNKEIVNINELALITISDPVFDADLELERSPLSDNICNQFADFIKVSFWDMTTKEENLPLYEGKKVIDNKTITDLYNFIIKNKDKKFLINCNAGHSRSAGVGVFVHYILGDYTDLYDFRTSWDNVISKHWRYAPNPSILDNYLLMFEK